MALVSCPECRKKISDKAISCPGCGFPMTVNRASSGARSISEAAVDTSKLVFRKAIRNIKYGGNLFFGCTIFLFFLVLFLLAAAASVVPMIATFNPKSDVDLVVAFPMSLVFLIGFGFVAKGLLVSLITVATNIIYAFKSR